jgi:hypothetical protein
MHKPIPFLFVSLLATGTSMAQWQQAAPAVSPSQRSDAAMTYSPVLGQVLLFGGAPAVGSPMRDTWAFDGTNWTQLAPSSQPSGRAQAGLVWDTNRGVAVLYGGANASPWGGPSIDETWEYDGMKWSRILPAHTPSGLASFGMAYDEVRGRVVVYGGDADNTFPIAERSTWEYDGFDWRKVTTSNSPGPLERPAMCHDIARGRTVLFGGINPQTGGSDAIWVYDGLNWTQLAVAGSKPAARTGAKMVYDSYRGICVLHGGADFTTGAPYNDTWEFDGTAWSQIGGPGISPARSSFAMAMDDGRGGVLLFGGAEANYTLHNDTWQFGASYQTFGVGCAGSNGIPALSSVGLPRIGDSFSIVVRNLNPGAQAALIFTGLSRTNWTYGALPADLTGFGLTGCTIYTSAEVLNVVGAANGSAYLTMNVPANVGLVGLRIHQQAASIEPGINPAGYVVSNAGTALIGN